MKIHHFETIGSTNDHLCQMAENGAPEWTVVTAGRQTAGKGRGGRGWWSPKGNLYMSVLLRPEVSPRQLLRLPVIASLAFLSALGDQGSRLRIKWPNDILLDGRKMAGILTESKSEGDKVLWTVIGFGINMVKSGNRVPRELVDRMAFVDDLELALGPEDITTGIIGGLKNWYGSMDGEGWSHARVKWSQNALLNTPYTYKDGLRQTSGVPVRLDDYGGLVMETPEGEVTVYSGELEKKQ